MSRSLWKEVRQLTDDIAACMMKSGETAGNNIADAYFRRAICYYCLGNRLKANQDLHAAGLLGCEEALLWSRYDLRRNTTS